jgi:hypothetical protein
MFTESKINIVVGDAFANDEFAKWYESTEEKNLILRKNSPYEAPVTVFLKWLDRHMDSFIDDRRAAIIPYPETHLSYNDQYMIGERIATMFAKTKPTVIVLTHSLPVMHGIDDKLEEITDGNCSHEYDCRLAINDTIWKMSLEMVMRHELLRFPNPGARRGDQ